MAFLQSRDRHSAEGEVEVVVRKGHRMGVAVEGNPPCVAVADYAFHSHPARNNPVAWLVGSVRDSVVGDCNHVEALVYHIHLWEGILDVEASGIGKGRDMGVSPLRVGPGRNEQVDKYKPGGKKHTSATQVT